MKRFTRFSLAFVLILALSTLTWAAQTTGEVGSELRIPAKGDDNFDNAVGSIVLNIDLQEEFGENGSWKLGIDTRFYDNTFDNLSAYLFDLNSATANTTNEIDSQLDFKLDEAYATFLSPFELNIDAIVGRQYITYGVGDGISTLNLCTPNHALFVDDLVKNKGRAVDGMRIKWYPGDYQVDLFLQARMTPTYLGSNLENVYRTMANEAITNSAQQELKAYGLSDQMIAGIPVNVLTTDPEPIDYGQDGPGLMLKTVGNFYNFDLGLNYQRGYVPTRLIADYAVVPEIDDGTGKPKQVTVYLNEKYLFMQKIGLTATGTVGEASVWSELTYTLPKEGFFASDLADNPTLPEAYRFSDEKYFTGLFGADYFFKKGTYVNAQFVYGFPWEYTKSMLNSYLTFDAYRFFLNDRLKAEAKWAYCLSDQGWLLSPEISYQLQDGLCLWGKANFLGGDDDSFLNNFEDLSQVVLGVTKTF